MANKIALGSPCGICGQDSWWDNRVGRTNPKAPEYKCGTKDCKDPATGYPPGRWERDRAKWGNSLTPTYDPNLKPVLPKAEPQGGRITGDDTTPDEQGKRVFTWGALLYTYGKLYAGVAKVMENTLGGEDGTVVVLDQQAIQAGVATLLIQGEKAHIPLLHPRKVTQADVVKKPEPKVPAHIAQGFAEMPEGLDNELPWP